MKCPSCQDVIFRGSNYCPTCGFELWRKKMTKLECMKCGYVTKNTGDVAEEEINAHFKEKHIEDFLDECFNNWVDGHIQWARDSDE